ncbi:MAG: NAD(P)H-dependent oxidoreductase subunit E [Methanomassiliicoccales archaeon]|nr:NAD(P)H-dependent oxidoreductase subunit E [Methanomassiliicoccales archaeon]
MEKEGVAPAPIVAGRGEATAGHASPLVLDAPTEMLSSPDGNLLGPVANKLARILLKYHKRKEDIISLLQDIQDEFGYLPRDVLRHLSKEIRVPEHEIYGVATFYSQFTFNEPGQHRLRICLGTACHVRGAVGVMEEVQRGTGIKPGQTSLDKQFSLETVMCVGACALGPVVVADGTYHGTMTPAKARKLIQDLREEGRP